jgi:hypothetical protein
MQVSPPAPVYALAPLLVAALLLGCAAEPGRLTPAVVDAATGEVTPARVEILTEDGKPRVPPQALTITLQCITAPPPEWAEWLVRSDRIRNPVPYSDGVSAAHLRRNRDALLAAIGEARRRYAAQLE